MGPREDEGTPGRPSAILGGRNCYYEPEDSNFTDVETDLEKEDQGSGHKLAVLVPYRDRFEELMEFIPHMQNFLKIQKIEHKIYVLNQVDSYRFNRAALINVGFELSMLDGSDYIVMNDVDILPLNQELSYEFPTKGPVHLAAPNLHPMYHFPQFLGAIVVLTRSQFKHIDGMSNKYWGWGVEDDELYLRLTHAGFNISRPENISTGIHNTFRQVTENIVINIFRK
ncbi:beta-1,4-galactosyltransferase 7-like [Hetaerina americana]|uniref:beta-1,4-galactosyltransferase 7-like n=1 Tax=Hetaerina americana TaxID=62018 RepID=UPI003A7F3595